MALVNLETYYSFPNITHENLKMFYSPDAGVSWLLISVPEGSYDIEDIIKYIKQKIKQGRDDSSVTLSANTNTLKVFLILENNYQVDFPSIDSISSVLGFNHEFCTANYQESQNPVNILSINSILVNVDIISGSYVNGQRNPTINSFFPAVSPGYKIIETPSNLVYIPITLDAIYSMEITMTDQNCHLLNLREENVSIRFHVREI